ncbi:hypothetical protein CBG46_03600 [Actinobacillus succinogenes]|uniref:PepSY domain-containing protein n=1 Tax=Actinobacillus succinogenes (strain ATCC 55618 / DSM 22257 / CCUG 43843 / 130Z) TaxID=339671 RepID=A6VL79_ACTSZ|nr:hypothetical protein [Actinobacillus succinogenes]ABR73726.1 conserved hypothetical protein [Actinobacillus succinogenes 130Z]PHI39816.1 hypothetical protein CBG46_03600 [Actinobacillus succinogenes]
MKFNAKAALIAIFAGFFSATVFAAHIPRDIYVPYDADIVKADRKGDGEFEAEFRLDSRDVSVPELAREVIRHARARGFHLEEKDIEHDDADLKFERGDEELDVSIELKDHHRIEYKADLDLDRN